MKCFCFEIFSTDLERPKDVLRLRNRRNENKIQYESKALSSNTPKVVLCFHKQLIFDVKQNDHRMETVWELQNVLIRLLPKTPACWKNRLESEVMELKNENSPPDSIKCTHSVPKNCNPAYLRNFSHFLSAWNWKFSWSSENH